MKAPSYIYTKNHSNKKRGFTLVELIVVIVIILILAAALIPQILRYVNRAQAAVCAENRHTVYIQVMATYTDGTYETLTDAFDALSDNEKEACPSGGDYSIVMADDGYNAEIICSYHDESDGADSGDNDATEDDGNTSGGGNNETETPVDFSKEFIVGDYRVTVDASLSDYLTKHYESGLFFYHNGEYYFSRYPATLDSLNNITGNGNIIKANPNTLVTNPDNANPGDFAIINNQLSICITNYWKPDWKAVINAEQIN